MYVISANWNICMPFDNGSTLKNVPPPSCQIFLLCSLLKYYLNWKCLQSHDLVLFLKCFFFIIIFKCVLVLFKGALALLLILNPMVTR